MFSLHPILAADTVEVAELEICTVLLMKDATYPWLILVPRRDGLRELHDLGDELAPVMEEVARASRLLTEHYNPAKINVAALGNVVPQLHIHVIARFEDDPAWPRPVWGAAPRRGYEPTRLAGIVAALRAGLARV